MENFYNVLGVRSNATLSEIKRAYREKAKQLHPDLTGDYTKKDEFTKLVQAYRVLSDSRQRNIFDESFFIKLRKQYKDVNSFNYYDWLKARQDQESRAKFIFYTLMHQKEDEAVAEFKRMQTCHSDFTLSRWFEKEDFLDYGYILAEELVIRGEYYDAFLLLEQIINTEGARTYFYIFYPEVISFTLSILKNNIDGIIADELALDVYERALELNFGAKNDSMFLRKMGDEYTRLGDSRTAGFCYRNAEKMV